MDPRATEHETVKLKPSPLWILTLTALLSACMHGPSPPTASAINGGNIFQTETLSHLPYEQRKNLQRTVDQAIDLWEESMGKKYDRNSPDAPTITVEKSRLTDGYIVNVSG
jgi:hypothetical protein